jgi:hypothetical protein
MTKADGTNTMATSIQKESRLEPPASSRLDEEIIDSRRLMQRQAAASPVWTVDWILTTAEQGSVRIGGEKDSRASGPTDITPDRRQVFVRVEVDDVVDEANDAEDHAPADEGNGSDVTGSEVRPAGHGEEDDG